MGFDTSSQKSQQTQSNQSSSSTRPTSPNELADYFWMMDSLTGGYRPQVGQVAYQAPAAINPYGGLWSYGGQVYDSERSARDAWEPANKASIFRDAPMGDPTRPTALGGNRTGNVSPIFAQMGIATPTRPFSTGAAPGGSGAATSGGSWTYGGRSFATQQEAEAAQAQDQAAARDGRLATWAKEGTREVNYEGLTPEQLRALGGAGATRAMSADRVFGDQMDRIRSDPRLSAAALQRTGQLATREWQGNRDAIAQEVEALLTQTMQEEAKRRYDAGVRNSDLTREDLALLAQMLQGFKGQYATSSSSGSGSGTSSGSSFGINLW